MPGMVCQVKATVHPEIMRTSAKTVSVVRRGEANCKRCFLYRNSCQMIGLGSVRKRTERKWSRIAIMFIAWETWDGRAYDKDQNIGGRKGFFWLCLKFPRNNQEEVSVRQLVIRVWSLRNNKNKGFESCQYRNGSWSQRSLKWKYINQVFSTLMLLTFWNG